MRRLIPFWVRLASWFSALLACLFLLSSWAIYRTVDAEFRQDLDKDLLALAQTELSSAVDYPGQGAHLHARGGAHQAAIFVPGGRLLAWSPGITPESGKEFAAQAVLHDGSTFFSAHGYRFAVVPAPQSLVANACLVLRISLDPLERTLAQIRASLWLWGLVGAAAGGLISAAVARRLTQPLTRMATLAQSIHEGELDARLDLTYESSEIFTLQRSFNEMLERLQSSLRNQEARAFAQKQFMADASHELRTPLHGLQGTLEVAQRRPRSEAEYLDVLQLASKETQRLSQLVQDMLLLSRTDLDRLDLAVASCRLDLLVGECREAHLAVAQEVQVQIVTDCEEIVFSADGPRIRQILDNLVSNALRYTPPASRIELGCRFVGPEIHLTVMDQGPGLETEEYEAIFERFVRLDPSRERTSGGLGLGLSIARSLAVAHSGRLTGERHPGGGSLFCLVLPAS